MLMNSLLPLTSTPFWPQKKHQLHFKQHQTLQPKQNVPNFKYFYFLEKKSQTFLIENHYQFFKIFFKFLVIICNKQVVTCKYITKIGHITKA